MLNNLTHWIFWTLSIYSVEVHGFEPNSCLYEEVGKNETIEKCKNTDGKYKFSAVYKKLIDINPAYCGYWKYVLDEGGNIDKRYDPAFVVRENQGDSCNDFFDSSFKYTYVYVKDGEKSDFFDLYLARSTDLKNCLSKNGCIKNLLSSYGLIKKYYYSRTSEINDLRIFLNTKFSMESCHINYWDNNYYSFKLCNYNSCWSLDIKYLDEKFKLDDFKPVGKTN